MSGDLRMEYTLWQMNRTLLQICNITSMKEMEEKEAG